MSSQPHHDIPTIDDLPYAALVTERAELERGITAAGELSGIAKLVAHRALLERRESVARAIQAFEKVTYRQLKTFGTMPR